MKKRNFAGTLKVEIVMKLIKGEKTISELCKEYEIVPGLVYNWKDQLMVKAHTIYDSTPETKNQDEKIKKYEMVIAKLTTQNDFLDKVLAHLR